MTCFTFIFDEKVATVRASTADAPSPMFSTVQLNRSVAHCVISGHWPSPTSSLLSVCFWTSSARPIPCRRMSWRNISMNWHRISSNCSIVRYSKASFQRYSKRHSSRHCWRSLSLIRPMSKRTDPSRTCRCCRNCSKGWSSSGRQHQISDAPVSVGTAMITPVHSVRDIGIYIDSDVTVRSHVAKTVSSCFAILRRIRSIRRSVMRPVLQTLVVSLVSTRLDYDSATLAGLPRQLLDRLKSVMHAAARLVFSARKYDHVTPLLRDLHWLRASQRIEYRLAVLAFRCQEGTAPYTCHLSSSACLMLFPVDACGLRQRRHWLSQSTPESKPLPLLRNIV